MRPPAGGTSSTGSPPRRKHSITGSGQSAGQAAPTTFFIASESAIDNAQTPTASVSETSFDVRGLGDEQAAAGEPFNEREEGRRRSTIIAPRSLARDASKDSLSMGSFASSSSKSSSPSRPFPQPRVNTADAANSKLPLSFQSPILGTSEPSSPKSTSMSFYRPSDDELMDEQSSQAILSDSDGEASPAADLSINATAPQFIMPSIMMPSRRPFSAKGNSMGRLKILLAGGSGVGKTSLIKSIVQTCEDIVHIDASIPTKTQSKEGKKIRQVTYNKTKQIHETYASTKAYPAWWSELEASNVIRRRRSGDGTVLERNICFVDTPGYDSGTSILEGMDKVLRYIESRMNKVLDVANSDDAEVLNLLGGGGGSQVDVVLYLLNHRQSFSSTSKKANTLVAHKPADLEFMKQLSQVTNVVPLLARVDGISREEVEQVKAYISDELASADLKPFPLSAQAPLHQVYTVCSSPSKDLENMDASLLMQSDYIQPLQPSELSTMIEHLFIPDTIHKLKYFAAKKIIQNRQTPRASTITPGPLQTSIASPSTRLTSARSPSDSFNATSQALISRSPGTMTYTRAAVTDHALREERLARIQLANWATNLQRSLANERARYEAIAKAERAEWLKARLGECIFEQEISPPGDVPKSDLALVQKYRLNSPRDRPQQAADKAAPFTLPRRALHDPADPLGLLRWRDDLSYHGILLLKVMGSAGVVGALGTFIFFSIKNWTEGSTGQPSILGGWWETFD